jgi:hypothetical protein
MVTKTKAESLRKHILPSAGAGGRNSKGRSTYTYRNRWKIIPNSSNSKCLDLDLSDFDTTDVDTSDDEDDSSESSYESSSSQDSDFVSCFSDNSCDTWEESEGYYSDVTEVDPLDPMDIDPLESKGGGHVLVQIDELSRMLTQYLRCACGEKRGKLTTTTVGISSRLDYFCCACENKYSLEPELTTHASAERDDANTEHEKNVISKKIKSHAMNQRMILLAQLLGQSKKGASFIAGMLDISSKIDSMDWTKLEDGVGQHEIVVAEKIMEENREEEVEGTAPDERGKHCIGVGADMGWQSGGTTYNSPSGHAILEGEKFRKALALMVYNKYCAYCIWAKKRGGQAKPHVCCKNYEGSSKGMEAKGILSMVTFLWNKTKLAVTRYVSDRDSTTRSVLEPIVVSTRKHKGKLPADHYPITFFTDPNHIVRCFGSKVYKLSRASKKKSRMSRSDAPRLKRNFSYWARKGNKGCIIIYRRQSRAVVEHHFNNHTYCSDDFCKMKGTPVEENEQNKKYRSKKEHPKLYEQAMAVLDKYTDETSLRELMHTMSTQKNESMNRVAMRFAPKHVCFSKSMALTYRLHMAVGINSVGHLQFYTRLFALVGLAMSTITLTVFERLDKSDSYHQSQKKTPKYRSARAHKRNAAMIKELKKEEEDRVKGMSYGIQKEEKEKKKRESAGKKGAKTCKHCQSTSHSRITSLACPMNPKNKKCVGNSQQDMICLPVNIPMELNEENTAGDGGGASFVDGGMVAGIVTPDKASAVEGMPRVAMTQVGDELCLEQDLAETSSEKGLKLNNSNGLDTSTTYDTGKYRHTKKFDDTINMVD